MSKKLPNGTWQSLEFTIQQAKEFMEKYEFDSLPGSGILRKLGYHSLVSAVYNYYGGFRKFRKILGQENKIREKGLWKSLDYMINEANKFMEEHPEYNSLPSGDVLTKLGYGGLSRAIRRYHSGLPKFRKILGQENKRIENGLWEKLDYTINEANKFMEEHPKFKTLPSSDVLTKLGYSSLNTAIIRYHDGFIKFRKILGQENKKRENGIWKSLDYTIKQANKFLEEHQWFDNLPSDRILRKLGYSNLSTAITRYYDGIIKFREILTQKLGLKSEKTKLTEVLIEYTK